MPRLPGLGQLSGEAGGGALRRSGQEGDQGLQVLMLLVNAVAGSEGVKQTRLWRRRMSGIDLTRQ